MQPRRFNLRRRLFTPRPEALEDRRLPTTFLVTTVADAGIGSLRTAIAFADAFPGPNTIDFRIGAPGVQTIRPTAPLPPITNAITIDGTTQAGPAGEMHIQLDGSLAGPGADGLRITSSHSVVRGLAINRFSGNGIALMSTTQDIVAGDFIGTDVKGTVRLGNGGDGVLIYHGLYNTVGGTTAVDRDVISANAGNGVELDGRGGGSCLGNVVLGDMIGTDVSGGHPLGNSSGVVINEASENMIGGAAGNVISGNVVGSGVRVLDGSVGNQVWGNKIGTNAAGTSPVPNGTGIEISGGSQGNSIGGPAGPDANIISDNFGDGVDVRDASTGFNHIVGNTLTSNAAGVLVNGAHDTDVGALFQGNTISANRASGVVVMGGAKSTRVLGNSLLNNGGNGVWVTGTSVGTNVGEDNRLTGPARVAPNVIRFNRSDGVFIDSGSSNSVLNNSIDDNGGLGIRLAAGANANVTLPVLSSANSSTRQVRGSFDLPFFVLPIAFRARIQFFSSPSPDPSGFGEGRTFLGETTVTVHIGGIIPFVFNLPPGVILRPGEWVSATLTDIDGNTSVFARSVQAT
jgi:trimeric autotransporter adhesin